VTIGHCVLVHACTIESGAFVGMRATLMDEVTVEGGAMVAAGALVTPRKRVARGQLWGGSPAKHMRDLSDEERASWGPQAEHYAALGAEYRKAQSARGG
jgi:carbonic anhydrase/acetyltransferase-like protein (isoleucine patch superfamily)